MKLLVITIALSVQCAEELDTVEGQTCIIHGKYCPEQVHLSFGDKTNDILVTWSTMEDTKESLLQFGVGKPDHNVTGYSTFFTTQWIHRALMKDLKFDTDYVYTVGSKYGWSKEFSFRTSPSGQNWKVRALIFGDLGLYNGRSIPFLKKEVANETFDVMLHLGDIAYNLHDNNGTCGDEFMNEIEPIAASVPYMVCPGNHEQHSNFSHFKNRFSMPGPFENMFYSFNIGPIHFISVNTEAYYDDTVYPAPDTKFKEPMITQYNWLVKDLEEANKPENREKQPWIILYGHRPFFCSNSGEYDQCVDFNYPHRVGIKKYGGYGLEKLFKDYGIDMGLWAHEHSYERLWPVYDWKVYNGSYDKPYVNPRAPVHITSGSAGQPEDEDNFVHHPPEWSSFRSSDYGYSKFYCHNHTHLYMEQYSVSPKDHGTRKLPEPVKHELKLLDSFWVVKDSHKPYDI